MAVPSAVCQVTVIVLVLAFESETVKLAAAVPLLPSVTVTSLIEIETAIVVGDRADALGVGDGGVGGGRNGQVDVEGLVALVQGVAVDVTATVLVVCPGAKVSRAGSRPRSREPAVAVPSAVASRRSRCWLLAVDSVTVKVAAVVPLFPSVTATSLIVMPDGVVVGDRAGRPGPGMIVGVARAAQVDHERLVGLVDVSPSTGTANG